MTARTRGRSDRTIGLLFQRVSFRTAIPLCSILVRRLLLTSAGSSDTLRLSFFLHDSKTPVKGLSGWTGFRDPQTPCWWTWKRQTKVPATRTAAAGQPATFRAVEPIAVHFDGRAWLWVSTPAMGVET